MKRSMIFGLMLAAFTLVSGVSQAGEGWYAGVSAGWSSVSESHSSILVGTGTDEEYEYEAGYAYTLSLGKRLNDMWRVEGELTHRKFNVDNVKDNAGTVMAGDGNLSGNSLMVNALYDVGTWYDVTAYGGGGIGWSTLDLDNQTAGTNKGNDTDSVFSYQLILGASYPVWEQVDLDLQYRWFATEKPTFNLEGGNKTEQDVETHGVTLGLRYSF
ncbi:MAG: opacity protein-like surface antigen [Chlamydiales bacterium]|jgi:opacity protein-like surface antigen